MTEVVDAVLTRLAPLLQSRPGTVNVEARTVEVVWSSGAAVKRHDWQLGHYMEELSMDPKHVRLDRLNAGASFIDSHLQFSIADRIGAIVPGTARIAGGKGICTVMISRSELGERVLQDLSDGLPLQISVGYRTHRYEKIEGNDGALPTLRATDWEPMEISAVTVPADPAAAARSSNQKVTEMSDTATREFGPAERAALVEKAGLNGTFLRRHANVPEVEFHAALMDEMARRSERSAIQTAFDPNHYGDEDHEAPLARALGEALFARVTPGHILSPAAKRYANMPLAEMARLCLDRAGRDTRGSTGQLIERALHSTSDFSALLGDATGRTLRAAYDAAPVAIKAICRQATAPNFKARHALQFGSAPDLLKVNESGEFKRGTIEESKASYALATFGRIFAASRQALINDNLDAFSSVPRRLAQAAAAFEANFIADLVEGNPTMGDGVELFHATHKNLGAAGAINETTLSAARVAMSRQTGLGGELIAVRPKYLVVPPELETAGEKVLASIAATKTADANPFAGQLTLLVEPRLRSATAWYLAASPDAIDTIEYAYLEGVEGPELLTREGFDVDGTEFKVRLDFGAGAIDWRGIYKNPGT